MNKSFTEIFESIKGTAKAVQAAISTTDTKKTFKELHEDICNGFDPQTGGPFAQRPVYDNSCKPSTTIPATPTILSRQTLTPDILSDMLVCEANACHNFSIPYYFQFNSEDDLIKARSILANVGFSQAETNAYIHPKVKNMKVCIRRTSDGGMAEMIIVPENCIAPFGFSTLTTMIFKKTPVVKKETPVKKDIKKESTDELEELTEEQIDALEDEDLLDESECFWCESVDSISKELLTEALVSESIVKKRVIRQGKVKTLLKSNRPGYKIKKGKEERMSPIEVMRKKRAATKAWLKKRSKKKSLFSKRKNSFAQRKRYKM